METFARAQVPQELKRWLPLASTLAFPEQGMTSDVAFVEPEGIVFKRCVDPLYLDWLRRERNVLQALFETKLPVPRILDYLDLGGEVWLVMTKLPGVPCAEALLHGSRASRLELFQSVGVALRQLHDTPLPEGLIEDGDWIERRLSDARAHLAWCDGTPELLARLRTTQPNPVPPTLIHGDLTLENVLVCDGAVSGFVDWAGGDFGDPRCDVALALLSNDEVILDDEMVWAFFAGYGEAVDRETRSWFEDLDEFF